MIAPAPGEPPTADPYLVYEAATDDPVYISVSPDGFAEDGRRSDFYVLRVECPEASP